MRGIEWCRSTTSCTRIGVACFARLGGARTFHQPGSSAHGDPSLRMGGSRRFRKPTRRKMGMNHDGWIGTLELEPCAMTSSRTSQPRAIRLLSYLFGQGAPRPSRRGVRRRGNRRRSADLQFLQAVRELMSKRSCNRTEAMGGPFHEFRRDRSCNLLSGRRSSATAAGFNAERDVMLAGEPRKWHVITLSFRDRRAARTPPQSFHDYRLEVTFACGDRRLTFRATTPRTATPPRPARRKGEYGAFTSFPIARARDVSLVVPRGSGHRHRG